MVWVRRSFFSPYGDRGPSGAKALSGARGLSRAEGSLELKEPTIARVEGCPELVGCWVCGRLEDPFFPLQAEERVQCTVSGMVSYSRKPELILTLPIPMEMATNKGEGGRVLQ